MSATLLYGDGARAPVEPLRCLCRCGKFTESVMLADSQTVGRLPGTPLIALMCVECGNVRDVTVH